jgi:hypothetical protein
LEPGVTKEELIALTLKQLRENIAHSPEQFEIECPELNPSRSSMSSSIIWRPRFNLDGNLVTDPTNNPRTVIVTLNHTTRELGCYIFLKDISSIFNAQGVVSEASALVKLDSWPLSFYKVYRDFNRLKNTVIKNIGTQENEKFLKKLCSVFPGTFEEDLLGKK